MFPFPQNESCRKLALVVSFSRFLVFVLCLVLYSAQETSEDVKKLLQIMSPHHHLLSCVLSNFANPQGVQHTPSSEQLIWNWQRSAPSVYPYIFVTSQGCGTGGQRGKGGFSLSTCSVESLANLPAPKHYCIFPSFKTAIKCSHFLLWQFRSLCACQRFLFFFLLFFFLVQHMSVLKALHEITGVDSKLCVHWCF